MIGPESGAAAGNEGRRQVEVSISVRTILVVAAAVAVAFALGSVGKVLLLIFVSAFSVAVLSPVVDAMERRLPWGRALCATVLVLGIAILGIGFVLVLLQAVVDGVRSFSDALPGLVDKARQSDLGGLINGRSDALDVLKAHASDITGGLGKASGGLARVGVSAFGVVTLVFSVTFLTLFGLIDEPRVRAPRQLAVPRQPRALRAGHGPDHQDDLALHAGQRRDLRDLRDRLRPDGRDPRPPAAFALAVIAGILDLIPNVGALLAGIIIGIVALSVSLGALIAFVIVIVVYQQIENYVLQPTIIGRAASVSGFTVIVSVLVFGSLFGVVGAIIGVPIAAALQIVVEELTSARRARIAAADGVEQQPA